MSEQKKEFSFKKRRYFSEAFKKEKVSEITSKKITIGELSKIYNISVQVIYKWIHKYEPPKEKTITMNVELQTEAQKTLFYKQRVADLERIVGTKQIQIDFLERLIEVASEELSIDLKKSFSTLLSNGSEKIQEKKTLQ